MGKKRLVEHFACTLSAYKNCIEKNNDAWIDRHEESLAQLNAFLPSGSGFDAGSKLDIERSTPDKLVFTTSFHHMREGFYTKWTTHDIIVTPSFIGGMNLRVTGRDHADIKDYIAETFHYVLSEYYTQGKTDFVPCMQEA